MTLGVFNGFSFLCMKSHCLQRHLPQVFMFRRQWNNFEKITSQRVVEKNLLYNLLSLSVLTSQLACIVFHRYRKKNHTN